MRFPRLNFETFGAIGAVIVSVAALFIAWDQAVVMRQEQHAGAWPFAHMEVNFNGDEEFDYIELMLSNPGVGPAIVREAHLLAGDDRVNNLWDLTRQTFPDDMLENIEFGGAESALGVIAVGEERQIMRLNWPRHEAGEETPFGNYLTAAISGEAPIIGLEVCYCSVYRRCWRGRSGFNTIGQDHEQVQSCEGTPDFISTLFQFPEEAGEANATVTTGPDTPEATTSMQGAKQ